MADSTSPLDRAIEAAGGMTSLARQINDRLIERRSDKRINSHSTVYQWKLTQVPSDYCPDIEAITGVRCEDLRPDVNWAVLRKTAGTWNGVERRKKAA